MFPELVVEDAEGYKAVNYSKLPLMTLQAVRELKAENDTFKVQLRQIKSLEHEVARLREIVCLDHPNAPVCK